MQVQKDGNSVRAKSANVAQRRGNEQVVTASERVVFRPVLDNPLLPQWPSLSRPESSILLASLISFLKGRDGTSSTLSDNNNNNNSCDGVGSGADDIATWRLEEQACRHKKKLNHRKKKKRFEERNKAKKEVRKEVRKEVKKSEKKEEKDEKEKKDKENMKEPIETVGSTETKAEKNNKEGKRTSEAEGESDGAGDKNEEEATTNNEEETSTKDVEMADAGPSKMEPPDVNKSMDVEPPPPLPPPTTTTTTTTTTTKSHNPPELLKYLEIGINEVTKSLERLMRREPNLHAITPPPQLTIPSRSYIDRKRSKPGASEPSKQKRTRTGPPPATKEETRQESGLSMIFVCRGDLNPTSLVSHLPSMVATLNGVQPQLQSKNAEEEEERRKLIYLVPLPPGAEIELSNALGLRRVACVGVHDAAPRSQSLLATVSKYTQPIQSVATTYVATHIKHLRTKAPLDPRAAQQAKKALKQARKDHAKEKLNKWREEKREKKRRKKADGMFVYEAVEE